MPPTEHRFLECCCTSAFEALQAQNGGASRIELCEDLSCGGVTPSEENIAEVLRTVTIPVNVLIRPRGGGFVYTEQEIESVLTSIRFCREAGVNGVVVGALLPDGRIDIQTLERMVSEAGNLPVTFHRAFDECADPFTALEEIISAGCARILTAGHASNVDDGAQTLARLSEKAAGRIVILAGSGVRPWNIASLESLTGVKEFHSTSHGPDGVTSSDVVEAMVRKNCSR